MEKQEIGEVGIWKEKAMKAKGGTVLHRNPDVTDHKKMCCEKFMGMKCNCKTKTEGAK